MSVSVGTPEQLLELLRVHGFTVVRRGGPVFPAVEPADLEAFADALNAGLADVLATECEITPEDVSLEPMLQFFGWSHLPEHLRERSAPFARLALHVVRTTPRNPERTVTLRKLLEAKDAGVRAHIPPPQPPVTGREDRPNTVGIPEGAAS